jgi:hypothetical protein
MVSGGLQLRNKKTATLICVVGKSCFDTTHHQSQSVEIEFGAAFAEGVHALQLDEGVRVPDFSLELNRIDCF